MSDRRGALVIVFVTSRAEYHDDGVIAVTGSFDSALAAVVADRASASRAVGYWSIDPIADVDAPTGARVTFQANNDRWDRSHYCIERWQVQP